MRSTKRSRASVQPATPYLADQGQERSPSAEGLTYPDGRVRLSFRPNFGPYQITRDGASTRCPHPLEADPNGLLIIPFPVEYDENGLIIIGFGWFPDPPPRKPNWSSTSAAAGTGSLPSTPTRSGVSHAET